MMDTTGTRIKTARKAVGMTQIELASKLGISYVGVSQWERDLRHPKYETLKRIADALGCAVTSLMEGRPLTNADRLNAMSIEDKAQFLYSIAYARETPWSKPFYEKFCKDCPAPEYTLDDGRKLCLHECEFKDGKCPHGTDIVWWLQQPAEEDTVSEKCTSIEVQHERR